MQNKETYGLVLYNRNYREDDKLVKIFTETNGKHMFFVKHGSKSRFNLAIQPLTVAKFILKSMILVYLLLRITRKLILSRRLMRIYLSYLMRLM